MPLVVDAIRAKNVWWDRLGSQQGAVAFADRQLKYKYKQWPMDEEGLSPFWMLEPMWIGTLDTRTFSTSSLGYTKASLMMSLHRKPPWVGILLHLLVWLSASCSRAAWRWKLALASQTEAKHVATTNDHAYSWLQLAHAQNSSCGGSDEG